MVRIDRRSVWSKGLFRKRVALTSCPDPFIKVDVIEIVLVTSSMRLRRGAML
jgi:hypothetical protein